MLAKTKKVTKAKVTKKVESTSCCKPKIGFHHNHGCVYGLGVIGAAIYYVSISTGFWMGVLGVLKALIWPLFLVLETLKFLGA